MNNIEGQSIGRYQVLEPLGEGGMAVVYRAFDTTLECSVAIKFIRLETAPAESTERTLKRFSREAKEMAALLHPNIVPVTDYGEFQGMPFLVMRYLPGGTLKDLIRSRAPLPYTEAARLLAPIARALEFAHRKGIVHRDVKPGNILITEDGQPMLSDFGVAKIIEGEGDKDHLTKTGFGIGTPQYMAPEQWHGKVSAQTDIYALGVVFFELLTGRVPYDADTPAAILIKQVNDPLPSPRKFIQTLPEVAEGAVLKALAKRPEDRYADMGSFAAVLEKLYLTSPAGLAKESPGLTSEALTVEGGTRIHGEVSQPAKKKSRLLPWLAGGSLVLLCIAASIVGILWGLRGKLLQVKQEVMTPVIVPAVLTATNPPQPTSRPAEPSTAVPSSTSSPAPTASRTSQPTATFTPTPRPPTATLTSTPEPRVIEDDFNAGTLDPAWTWVDPLGDCRYSLSDNPGFLRITAPRGNHDFNSEMGNTNAPRLSRVIRGNFEMETKVTTNPRETYQNGGIYALVNRSNYAFFGRGVGGGGVEHLFIRDNINRTTTYTNSKALPQTVYLKIVRNGVNIQSFYSADGSGWVNSGSIDFPGMPSEISIGLAVINNWQNNSFYADYDYFRITLNP